MGEIRIKLGDGTTFAICECCGAKAPSVVGFVYEDDNAYAVYYAGWTEGHAYRRISLVIGLGSFDDDALPADRRSFGLRCWEQDDEIRFEVQEPMMSRYGDVEYLGSMLTRSAALADPDIDGIFHIAEHIAQDDARVRAALEGAGAADVE